MGAGAWHDVPFSRRNDAGTDTMPTAPPLPSQPPEYHVPLREESFTSSPPHALPTSPARGSSVRQLLPPFVGDTEGVGAAVGAGGATRAEDWTPNVGGLPSSGGGNVRIEDEWRRPDNEELSTRPPSSSMSAPTGWRVAIPEGGRRRSGGDGEGRVASASPVGSTSSGGMGMTSEGRLGKERHRTRASEGASGSDEKWESPNPLLVGGSPSRWQENQGQGPGSSTDRERGTRRGGGGGGGQGGKAHQGGPSSTRGGGSESAGQVMEPSGPGDYTRGVPDDYLGRHKHKSSSRNCCNFVWVVPGIVIACCVVFGISMYRNNCPGKEGAEENKCVAPFLGRFAFEPMKTNQMLGPSPSTLLNFGALETGLLRERLKNKYRLFTYVWLHAGVIHLVINMLGVLVIGLRLEKEFGCLKTLVVYLVSAFGGSLMSALLLAGNVIVVGASGALFGLLGATLAELIVNWTIYERRLTTLFTLVFLIAVNLVVGLTPHVDNFSHIGGFVAGMLLGFVFLLKPQYGYYSYYYAGNNHYTQQSVLPLPMDDDIYPPPKPKRMHNSFQRTIRCVAFALLLFGFISASAFVLLNMDGNKECKWCRYMDCVDSPWWNCNQMSKTINCTSYATDQNMTIICPDGKSFLMDPGTSFADLRRNCVNKCS